MAYGLLLGYLSKNEENENAVKYLVAGGRPHNKNKHYALFAVVSPFVVFACMVGLFQSIAKNTDLVDIAHAIGFMGYCLLFLLLARWFA